MQRVDPSTPEGKLWLDQFNSNNYVWTSSKFTDHDSLRKCFESLEHLFHRCPDYSQNIRFIALNMVRLTLQANKYDYTQKFSELGLDAANLLQDNDENIMVKIIISLYLTESIINTRKFDHALNTVLQIKKDLSNLQNQNSLTHYLAAKYDFFNGYLLELSLENLESHASYKKSFSIMNEILLDPEKNNFLTKNLSCMIVGLPSDTPTEIASQVFPLAQNEIQLMKISILSGLIRTFNVTMSQDQELFASTWLTLFKIGIPTLLSEVEIALMLKKFTSVFYGENYLKILSAYLDQIHRINSDTSFDVWESLLLSAMGTMHGKMGNLNKMNEFHQNAINFSQQSTQTSNLCNLFLTSSYLLSEHKSSNIYNSNKFNTFLEELNDFFRLNSDLISDLRIKSFFDKTIAVSIDHAITIWNENRSISNSARLSVLLDLLRQERVSIIPHTDCLENLESELSSREGLFYSLDRLGRISQALENHTSSLVLILQSVGNKILFLAIDSSSTDIISELSTSECFNEFIKLEENPMKILTTLSQQDINSDPMVEQSIRSFNSMPQIIRDMIHDTNVLYIIPDLQTELNQIPYELLHDGHQYLGISKIISRLSSLQHAVSILEQKRITTSKKRCLVVSAPDVVGFKKLDNANIEHHMIETFYSNNGWELTKYSEDNLSKDFIVKRIEYLSLLHLIGHGVVESGSESFVLPKNRSLSSTDIGRNYFRKLPFVYLNACSLGKIRYLGGGVGRGISNSFIEKGSPAVIANLTPIEDESAMMISSMFYKQSMDSSVGEALCKVRKLLSNQGVLPVFWGSTVLFGDPHAKIHPSEEEFQKNMNSDLTISLLDAYSEIENVDPDLRRQLWVKASSVIIDADSNLRLMAALCLIKSNSVLPTVSSDLDVNEIETQILLAQELEYLPFIALLLLIKNQTKFFQSVSEELDFLEYTIKVTEPLSGKNSAWKRILLSLHQKKKELEFSQSGLKINIHNPSGSEKNDDELRQTMAAVLAAQSLASSHFGNPEKRIPEVSLEDVCWNAIIFNNPNILQDMRERAGYIKQITLKIIQKNFVSKEIVPYLHVLLCGILPNLWDVQKQGSLEKEFAELQTFTLLAFIQDLEQKFSNNTFPPNFQSIQNFSKDFDSVLKYLDSLSYEEVHDHLDEFPKLKNLAQQYIDLTMQENPNLTFICAAYVFGTILTKNIYSYIQGSVPEMFDNKLNEIYHDLVVNDDNYFYELKTKGSILREQNTDLVLEKWKIEDSVNN